MMQPINCPVCGNQPKVSRMADPWNDYLVHCPRCGFSYSMNGSFGNSVEDAIEIWNNEVKECGLDYVSISAKDNKEESLKWKKLKQWFDMDPHYFKGIDNKYYVTKISLTNKYEVFEINEERKNILMNVDANFRTVVVEAEV